MKKILVGNPCYFELRGEIISAEQPIYLIMDMPFGCQLNCLKCYRRKNIRPDKLSIELRKKTISEAKEIGAKVFALPGEGEPLLYWETTRALIEHADSLGLITILYTNGICLTEDIAQFLFEHNVSLVVSCDSFNAERYHKLTGGGDINVAKKNLEMATRIYQNGVSLLGDTMQTRMALISIVGKDNVDEISLLKKWAEESQVYFICNFPVKMGGAEENWATLVGDQEPQLREIAQKYSETHFGGITTPTLDGRCAALYHGITIDTNGLILPCPASVDLAVGYLGEGSLAELRTKALEYANSNGCPPCILRFNPNPELRKHDGIIITSV